jgi:hypothetical protein
VPQQNFAADVTSLEAMIALGHTGTPEDIAGMAIALFFRFGLCLLLPLAEDSFRA